MYLFNQAFEPAPKLGPYYMRPYHGSPYPQPTSRDSEDAICGPRDNLIFLYKKPATWDEYFRAIDQPAENYPVVCTPDDWASLGNPYSGYKRNRRSPIAQKLSELVDYLKTEVKYAKEDEDNDRRSHAEYQLRKLKDCADEWILHSLSWGFRGDDEVARKNCVSIMTSFFYLLPPSYAP